MLLGTSSLDCLSATADSLTHMTELIFIFARSIFKADTGKSKSSNVQQYNLLLVSLGGIDLRLRRRIDVEREVAMILSVDQFLEMSCEGLRSSN